MQACLLIYDIPEASRVPNPSGFLRRMAVRINLSCWVVPEGDIPYARLNEMAAGGASWHVVRFDAAEAGKLVAMAAAAIRRELRDALRRAKRSAARAAAALESGKSSVGKYTEQARAQVSRVKRLMRDLKQAAERFEIAPESLPLTQAARGVDAIQAAMHTRARLYAEAAEQARGQATAAGEGMANAAAADTVPAGVLADFIEEAGGDAAALREVFQLN